MAKTSNTRLVFSSVGDNSDAWKSWVDGPRNYQVAVVYYGDDAVRANIIQRNVEFFFQQKGSKFQNFERYRDCFAHQQFFVTDDDISLSPAEIDLCFDYTKYHNIAVASPAHSRSGRVSWRHMLRPLSRSESRRTNFVELTAMFLSSQAVDRFIPVYGPIRKLIVGWGIDFMFSNICRDLDIRILDFCEITNPYSSTRKNGRREIDQLQSRFERRRNWHKIKDLFPLPGGRVLCERPAISQAMEP